FSKNLKDRYEKVDKKIISEKTDKTCPKCNSPLMERLGRFGRFYACSKFPECKYTQSVEKKEEKLGIKCQKCKEGEIIAKKTRRGKIFYGCSLFPKCDFALWQKPVNEFCKNCGSIMVEERPYGKSPAKDNIKIKCSNKECGQQMTSKKL
ncbi:MAG: topoisomerase DNA-binding C4 zinc finger domain-containing protein, partial [Candidatus Staskawiczbacteria bacterium]|nr:topoisomerase DNA-binding C4 zinc finger domain-containing protein [Candidatus Staskawiczbacteria bacterium]